MTKSMLVVLICMILVYTEGLPLGNTEDEELLDLVVRALLFKRVSKTKPNDQSVTSS